MQTSRCRFPVVNVFRKREKSPIHLAVACCIRCVMQHCFSLVSSALRWQLTAVLGGSFVLLPYLCAERNSVASHPACFPHPTSLYITLNLRSTSGDAGVGYICLPTQKGDGKDWDGFQTLQFYVNVIHDVWRRPFELHWNNSRCYWDNMQICLCKVRLKACSLI